MQSATASILETMSRGVGMRESIALTAHKRPWIGAIYKSLAPVVDPCAGAGCDDPVKRRRYDLEIRWVDGAPTKGVFCLRCIGRLLYGHRL